VLATQPFVVLVTKLVAHAPTASIQTVELEQARQLLGQVVQVVPDNQYPGAHGALAAQK